MELADRRDKSTANERRGRLVVGPVNLRLGQQEEPLGWVAFLDYTDWKTGATSPLTVGFRMGPAAVYRYLSGPSFAPLDNYNLGQIFLILLAVIAGLFLIIQAVALSWGSRSRDRSPGRCTSCSPAPSACAAATSRHKIADPQSRDQLGELAESFNSMTASIEELLLRRRRRSGSSRSSASRADPDVAAAAGPAADARRCRVTAHCEPAREVGGDYYDFLPLGDHRLGMLIADVVGKGDVGGALHGGAEGADAVAQPAARVAARAADRRPTGSSRSTSTARSFITMTYAVVDLRARTLTYARAGHTAR